MMVQDPVCLMTFSPREAKATAEYEGKLYYFCSAACRDTFISQPGLYQHKVKSMHLTVGVMGSAGNEAAVDVIEKSMILGQSIAQRGFILITGACPGLPYECARGAKQAGGLSIGILGEFAIAFDEGKLIGVLQGSGGITDQIPDLVASFQKDSGARLVYSADPLKLIDEMAKLYTEHHYQHPSCFCDAMSVGAG